MQTPIIDYYQVLGVSRQASDKEIQRSFHKYAMQFHPDRNPGNKTAEELFKRANAAYIVLSDPLQRRTLDQQLASPDFIVASNVGGQSSASYQDQTYASEPSDPSVPEVSDLINRLWPVYAARRKVNSRYSDSLELRMGVISDVFDRTDLNRNAYDECLSFLSEAGNILESQKLYSIARSNNKSIWIWGALGCMNIGNLAFALSKHEYSSIAPWALSMIFCWVNSYMNSRSTKLNYYGAIADATPKVIALANTKYARLLGAIRHDIRVEKEGKQNARKGEHCDPEENLNPCKNHLTSPKAKIK